MTTLRRIDYIRQTASVPRNGLNAPPGTNPYADEFGILPYHEVQRIFAKIGKRKLGGRPEREKGITMPTELDIRRTAGINRNNAPWYRLLRGDPNAYGRKRQRALSRVLMLIDSGQMFRLDGKLVILPEPPAKPQGVMRVALNVDRHGVLHPTITRMEPQRAFVMPKLFQSFSLTDAKKHGD